MKNKTIYIIIVLTAVLVGCNNYKKKETNEKMKQASFIGEYKFPHTNIDSTISFNIEPGDTISNDLRDGQEKKIILSHDAAHKYKLISLQKKTDFYTAIIVLYVMEGGNNQYYITIDNNTGMAISDLLVQSNHRDGPIEQNNGNVIWRTTVDSHFNGDTITVIEKRFMSEGYEQGAKEWIQKNIRNYTILANGKFDQIMN